QVENNKAVRHIQQHRVTHWSKHTVNNTVEKKQIYIQCPKVVISNISRRKMYLLLLFSFCQSEVQGCKACVGWVFHGGKCYFFSTGRMNWTQIYHMLYWGILKYPWYDFQYRLNYLFNFFNKCVYLYFYFLPNCLYSSTENKTHWIGLNDLETEGRWFWVDNKPLNQTGVFSWLRSEGKDEPDNWTRQDPLGEDCHALAIESSLGFSMVCWRYVCEKFSAS
uniref:C-type lectin domain-containing protein n=1 Tax=Hucho hucho TaxID=62062 RepID=A0A4W5NAQ9_9TELE